jgi:Zn-dependent protease with chaperone function
MGTVKSVAAPPSAGRDWGLIAAMTVSAHPVAFLFGLALIGFSGFVGDWGLLAPPVAWMVFGLVAAAVNRHQLPGRAIRPANEPELAALVQAVAERMGFRVPLLVRVIPVPDAGLIATKVTGVRVFVLVLGWPLLRGLTAAQLAAVVAHELAHEMHIGDRRTSRLLAARESLVESMDNGVHVPAAVAGKLLRATQRRSWELETAADASSADVAGSTAVRGALEQSGLIMAAFEVLGERWASALADDGSYPQDLYDALDAAMGDAHAARLVAAAAQAADDADGLDPYGISTHPPLATRVAAIPERPQGDWDPNKPVPMRDGEAVDRWCVQELVGSEDPSNELRPVRVLDCAPERFDVPVGEANAALVEATGCDSARAAMAAILEAIADGTWVQLARAIDPEIGSAPPALRPSLGRDVLVGCLGRAVSGGLLDAGWHRSSRWMTSALVNPDGEDVDVRMLIEQALDSADPSTLRSLLALGDPQAMA